MTLITLYHNPSCSKSRATLALLNDYQGEHGGELRVVEYLNTPPTPSQLATLVEQLNITAHELLRPKEAAYALMKLSAQLSAEQLLQAVAEAPILMERPIVVCQGKAAIGRPPEQVLDILPHAE
jgi:arsenate reductase